MELEWKIGWEFYWNIYRIMSKENENDLTLNWIIKIILIWSWNDDVLIEGLNVDRCKTSWCT